MTDTQETEGFEMIRAILVLFLALGTAAHAGTTDFDALVLHPTTNDATAFQVNNTVGTSVFAISNAGAVTMVGAFALGASSVFEGATDDAFETTLAVADPTTPDKTITLPNATGTVVLSTLLTNAPDAANSVTGASAALVLEGTADAFETSITATDPTADRTATIPDASGTFMLSSAAADVGTGLFQSGQDLKYEGTTADAFEGILRFPAEPTADAILAIAATSGFAVTSDTDLQGATGFWGGANSLIFEGATADGFETTVTLTDPTADQTLTIPNGSGSVFLTSLATNVADAANAVTGTTNGLLLEGATADAFEMTLSPADPGADVTVTIPATTGTLFLNATALTIGATGTAISKSVRTAAAVDIANIVTFSCVDTPFTVTGAAVGDECALGLPAAAIANVNFTCFISAADTAQIRACNVTVGSIDPASATYSVRSFAP